MKKISPLNHQKLVSSFLSSRFYKGLIVFHSVGSGKTLTSLLSIKKLLQLYPNKKVIVITPSSLVSNYTKELNKVGLHNYDNLIITSYTKFVNEITNKKNNTKKKLECNDSILVVDEAHHLGRKGVIANHIKKCAREAFKVILLTATVVQNSPEELANLLYMITVNITEKEIRDRIRNSFREGGVFDEALFRCKISFYKNSVNTDFPTKKEHIVRLHMNHAYYLEYLKIQEDFREDLPEIFNNTKNLLVFLNGIRRAVNATNQVSPKIEWILHKLKTNDGRKTLIYSNFVRAGLELIKSGINEKFVEVSGNTKTENKDKAVKDFNKGNVRIMLISSSGAEGLDLKGVRDVIILDQHWNTSRIEQVIGRAVRYKSHAKLPLKERNVDIWFPIIEKPKKLLRGDNIPLSADEILYNLSHFKQEIIEKVYKNLEKVSIENNPGCINKYKIT